MKYVKEPVSKWMKCQEQRVVQSFLFVLKLKIEECSFHLVCRSLDTVPFPSHTWVGQLAEMSFLQPR